MVISQGDIWWADLPSPTGSGPGFRRPVVVVQGDALNRSQIATAVCVPLTSNLRWAEAPGNVLLTARAAGLPNDSVANTSQIITLDRDALTATYEAGILGEHLEHDLGRAGFTLGHFPSSIMCSTLGGWLAARSRPQSQRSV